MISTPLTKHGSNLKAQLSQPKDYEPSKLQLGILDSGLITAGKTAAQTINETLMSASLADSLGYSRYWLTEHHQTSFAWASPEILLTSLAQCTDRIRLGTAGILLYFYSPLKVAEIFRLLELVYPQRFDLGIAAGNLAEGNKTVKVLSADISSLPESIESRKNYYAQKVTSLINYLTNNFPVEHRFAQGATPTVQNVSHIPQMWLLGTGRGSMNLGAVKSTAFSYSLCHGYSACDPCILAEYRSQFQLSQTLSQPKCNVAVAGICAETEVEAKQQQIEFDRDFQGTTKLNVVGNPEQCKEQLLEIQKQYGVEEIIFLSASSSFEQRQLSYEMLAEVLNLKSFVY
jgi:luciferase family oxidoreductase group 1